MNKKRLDLLILERNPDYSRMQVQSWIMQSKVLVDDQIITKPGTLVKESSRITCMVEEPKFVSRAGFKLEAALDHFALNVQGLSAMDAGISTGGFSDCLLQRGVARIYGVDVGYGQLHEKIRNDKRLILFERTNLKDITAFEDAIDLVTLDLSFISILKVMDAVNRVIKPEGMLIALIKPQFEAGKHEVGRRGIISDPVIHQSVVERIIAGVQSYGYAFHGYIESPITGATGNKEFLAYFSRKKAE